MAEIEYSSDAAEWLQTADTDTREQVRKKLEQARDFPDHFLTPLTGRPYYKLRAGDYRAEIDWRRNENPEVLFVRKLGHRDGFWD